MIIKLLALSAIMYVVYIMFFKTKHNQKTDDNEQIDTMMECAKCNTFVSKDEAIISDGKYFCSNECLK